MINSPPSAPGPAPTSSAAVSPAAPATAAGPRLLSLRFTGSTGEYFRLWIVNLCLTLLTLGIYSAWAKVRKKRFLYSNTVLDGTPFQYLGQPLPILKGRLIAAVLFGLWWAATHYLTALLVPVLVIGALLAPWVMVRAAAFNARYSAYRNLTFDFSGDYRGAAKVLYGWLLIVIVTIGFATSWWQQRIKRYMIGHFSYGGVHAEFSASGGSIFKIYFIGGLLMGLGGTIVGLVSSSLFGIDAKSADTPLFITGVIYSTYVGFFAYVQARLGNLVWNHTRLGPLHFHSHLRARELLSLYVTNALAIIGSLGLLIPWATIRTLKYRADHFAVNVDGNIADFRGDSRTAVQAAGAEVGEFFDFDMSL